jgi:hypothetical protein
MQIYNPRSNGLQWSMAAWYLGTIFYIANSSALPYFLLIFSSPSYTTLSIHIQYFFYNLLPSCSFIICIRSPFLLRVFMFLPPSPTSLPVASPLFNLDGFHGVILLTPFFQLPFSSTNLFHWVFNLLARVCWKWWQVPAKLWTNSDGYDLTWLHSSEGKET